jgi:hypothetical protein
MKVLGLNKRLEDAPPLVYRSGEKKQKIKQCAM